MFELLRVSGHPVTDEELLDNLKRVANLSQTAKVTQAIYQEFGNFDCSTVERRFKTWNNAIKLAGLKISNEINLTDEKLFNNILILWQYYGR
jgi:hypothetical protein